MEIDRTSHSYLLGVTEAKLKAAQYEVQRLRTALQKIVDEADDYEMDMAAIARHALAVRS